MTSRRVFVAQVRATTAANLKSRYRQTIAGFLWVVFNPLVMYGVQSLVFKHFLRLGVPNYGLFLLSGLLPWIFISQTLEMCTSLLVVSGKLIKSFPVNPLVYLVAQVADNTINFLAAFTIVLIPVWSHSPGSAIGLLVLPLPLLVLTAAVFGLAWLLATLQVFFRDTRYIVSFALSIAFFITPVFYPVDMVPEKYGWITIINPLRWLLEPFRCSLYAFEPAAFIRSLAIAAAIAAIFIGLAAFFWRASRNAVYLNV